MLVILIILLHVVLKFMSKLNNYKQEKSQIEISIIYKTEIKNSPQKTNLISLSTSVFLVAFAISGFFIHPTSREIQFFILLPLQIISYTLVFPIFIIGMSTNMKSYFLQKHSWILKCKFFCKTNNQVGTLNV